MKNILIIFGGHNGLPDDETTKNLIYTMRGRMEHLKNSIYGHNVLSFDLSRGLNKEESQDLRDAVKSSDEVVVFDIKPTRKEITDLIGIRLMVDYQKIIFFGEESEPDIERILKEYKRNTQATPYPQKMIEMMQEW